MEGKRKKKELTDEWTAFRSRVHIIRATNKKTTLGGSTTTGAGKPHPEHTDHYNYLGTMMLCYASFNFLLYLPLLLF